MFAKRVITEVRHKATARARRLDAQQFRANPAPLQGGVVDSTRISLLQNRKHFRFKIIEACDDPACDRK
jgi:hypothetical protein